MRKGEFDLGDLRDQLAQMQQMGGIGGLMGMMPGIAKMKNQIASANLDEKVLKRQMAIIDSMTPRERRNPDLLKASRKKRIAAGSGTKPEDINRLLKMHRGMADMMKAMGGAKARADGRPRADDGLRRRHAVARKRWQKLAEKMPGGLPPGMPRRGRPAADDARPAAEFPRNAARRLRLGKMRSAFGGFPGLEKEIANDSGENQKRKTPMSLKSGWPARAPRSARSITSWSPTAAHRATAASSSGSATSIRCCAKDNEDRLKLDLEKVKAWMAKGAQPSDRVSRFLDAAGM